MPFLGRQNLKPVVSLLPEEPGLRAHVFRVSALATFVAKQQAFTEEQVQTLEWAALLHHYQMDLTDPVAASRIFADLGMAIPGELGCFPENAAEIVRVLRGLREPADSFSAEAAALIESANLFDESFENLPYDGQSAEEAAVELLESGLLTPEFVQVCRDLRVLSRAQLLAVAKQLPVFPKAATEALRIARDPNAGTREIEGAVSKDPVLAGEIMQLANSGIFGLRDSLSAIGPAIARVGTIAAGKLIAAAALRRCFVSANLHRLWNHSFEAGEDAALLASESGRVDLGEAFLAGLVHDVGRLAFELSPAAAELHQWMEAGFPATYAEFLLSGTDHAEIGAQILEAWKFPEAIVEAVRFHHRPEITESPLAAAVYAAEEIDEALPSCARDHAASKRLEVAEIRKMLAAG